jgi:hypothetical protein
MTGGTKTATPLKAPLIQVTGKPARPEDQVFGGNYQVSGRGDGYVFQRQRSDQCDRRDTLSRNLLRVRCRYIE